jgi:hypothetical protein
MIRVVKKLESVPVEWYTQFFNFSFFSLHFSIRPMLRKGTRELSAGTMELLLE